MIRKLFKKLFYLVINLLYKKNQNKKIIERRDQVEDIILIGYGGHAKSVADCIERNHKFRIAGYTEQVVQDSGYKYLGPDDKLEKLYKEGIQNAAICIGYLGKGNLREEIYQKLKKIGYYLPVISDPSAIISDTAVLGEGTFVGKGAIINSGARIGKECIINTMSLVEHDCIVEDFVHLAVGAILCGGVFVGRSVFVGASATVLQGISIPENTTIPAGIVVRKGAIMSELVKNSRGGGNLY